MNNAQQKTGIQETSLFKGKTILSLVLFSLRCFLISKLMVCHSLPLISTPFERVLSPLPEYSLQNLAFHMSSNCISSLMLAFSALTSSSLSISTSRKSD